ncbi:MAG: YbhB/YbcL family Raf kinase inhibitor-like protein [Candidatus Eremiobacteraeota bacterium]|nr:YbhB/YbcL family Raf kinase inhibitor-like protein [Candidatus Eremiobacteraeota bacterium]
MAAHARTASLSVGSTTFRNNATLPARSINNRNGCTGKNVSPELHWSAGPKRTKSYAVTTWDPDAPAAGGFWHWVLFDIPAQTHRIAEGQSAGVSGATSFDAPGYGGPCPPPGPAHHYRFTVYALNVPHVGATAQTKGPELLAKMHGHVLAAGVTVALYKR